MKQLILPCLLIMTMLLSACMSAGNEHENKSEQNAGGDTPDSLSGSAGDPVPAPSSDTHALSSDELDALWAYLEGKWIPVDPNAGENECPVYCFFRTEDSGYGLANFNGFGSGGIRWTFDAAFETDNVHTLEAISDNTEGMTIVECDPGTGTRFTLAFSEERLTLSWSRPVRVEWEKAPRQDPPMTLGARVPTDVELKQLEQSAKDVRLSDGSRLLAGYQEEPTDYRKVTDSELEEILNGSAPAARSLSDEEMTALWEQLDGTWVMGDPAPADWNSANPLQSHLRFDHYYESEGRQYVMSSAVPAAEWVSFYISAVAEQGNAYIFEVDQKWGMMFCNEYEPGVSDSFKLVLEEDGMITLCSKAPARYGELVTFLTDEGDEVSGYRWRPATPEEERRELEEGAAGVLTLENGDEISSNYSQGPHRYHRETWEEAKLRVGG